MLINVPVNPLGLLNYVGFALAIVDTEGTECVIDSAMDMHGSVEMTGVWSLFNYTLLIVDGHTVKYWIIFLCIEMSVYSF